jgi:uroporphyrinogen decarboxylase
MTPRERFNAQMHYKPFDRTVNMEFGYWKENYETWDIFLENNIKYEWDANHFFAFEEPCCVGGHYDMCPGFEEKVLEEKEKTVIKLDPQGLIVEVPKDGHSSIPHYLGSSIETPEDWKAVKERSFLRDADCRKPNFEWLDQVCRSDRDYPVGVYCGSMIGRIRDMLTVEGLAYACADYPEMVEDMVETCCRMVENVLDQLLPHFHFDFASGWEDICCNNGPLVSLGFFRDVVMPRYKRIHKKLADAGIDIWFTDCDGDVRPLLPYFLEGGINCLFPFEVNGCAHPGELLDAYPGQLRIMGGVNKMKLIAGKEETKAYLESLIPYVEKGGYIPFCDHRCPPDVAQETYLYYLDLKKELFGMK